MAGQERPLEDRLRSASWGFDVGEPGTDRRSPWTLTALEPDGRLAVLHGSTTDREAAEAWLPLIVAAHERELAGRAPAGEERLNLIVRLVSAAVVVCALAGIWLGDGRWFGTAAVAFVVLCVFTAALQARQKGETRPDAG